MATSVAPNETNRYKELLLTQDNAEIKKTATFVAFFSHIRELGRVQDVAPDLVHGKTEISIPAYYALDGHGSNPINSAALSLLPKYSYHSGYGNTTDVRVDDRDLQFGTRVTDNELQIARHGGAYRFIVAKSLGFLDPITRDTLNASGHTFTAVGHEDRDQLREITYLMDGSVRDINDAAVGEVTEIAERTKQRGYVDFLDYLVDMKEVIGERVETIFGNGVNE